MHIRWVIVSAVALLTALPSFIQADDGLIPIQLPGGVMIQAEVANTMKKRAEGLMYREHLAKDRGMLFTFDQAQPWTFWMKNTKIPLDIIWMNEKKQIIHIARNVPICTRTTTAVHSISRMIRRCMCWSLAEARRSDSSSRRVRSCSFGFHNRTNLRSVPAGSPIFPARPGSASP